MDHGILTRSIPLHTTAGRDNNREDAIGAELVVVEFPEFDDLDLPDMETVLAECSPAKDGRDADYESVDPDEDEGEDGGGVGGQGELPVPGHHHVPLQGKNSQRHNRLDSWAEKKDRINIKTTESKSYPKKSSQKH